MVTSADIETLFRAQLARIEDPDTRAKTIAAWVEAARLGGFESADELRALPFTLLAETRGLGLVEHTIAVTEGACGLARAQLDAYGKMPYAVNIDRLVAGGLLHDVGKLVEIEKDGKGGFSRSRAGRYTRHPIAGAIIAARVGLGGDIVNIIACHAREGEGAPKVLEAVLIHQADFATFDPLVMKGKGLLIE